MARRPQKESLRSKRARAFRFRGRTDLRGVRTTAGRKARASWIVKRDWNPEIDPALIVDHVRDVILAMHRTAILAGEKADGSGPQPPRKDRLDKIAKASPAVRAKLEAHAARKGGDGKRGVDTGFMANHIHADAIRMSGPRYSAKGILTGPRMTKSQRGKPIFGTRAASTIYMPDLGDRDTYGRSAFLGQELKRNVEYLYTEGAVEAAIDLAVDQAIDVAFIEGASRDARMGPLLAKDTIHK